MSKYRQKKLEELTVIKALCSKDILFSTRYFFYQTHGRKYIVGPHHRIIAAALNMVIEGKILKLMINISPRYGKSELSVKQFITAGFGLNPKAKFIHLSYSDDLATDNSQEIKEIIESIAFRELYGNVELKKDSRSKSHWKTTTGGELYATGFRGQVTGFGCGILGDKKKEDRKREDFNGALVMDDSIKPEDAEFDLIREAVNNRYSSTIKNRINSPEVTPQIYIGHRVHPRDLSWHLQSNEKGWHVITIPAILSRDKMMEDHVWMDDNSNYVHGKLYQLYGYKSPDKIPEETACWKFMHNLKQLYEERGTDAYSISSFTRQYMQNPKPLSGLMYPSPWKIYDKLPFELNEIQIKSQTDCADTGDCYLCSIKYVPFNELKYVLDVYYTQEPTEVTQPKCVEFNVDVNYANFESNNGGKAFAINVEAGSRAIDNHKTTFSWYHESSNKDARILANASTVQNLIVFPVDWAVRFPIFYDHITNYMLTGRNKYKDGPDVLTAIIEKEPYGDTWAEAT
jgi:predicted phage terminase large subunit-like protein